MFLHKSHNMFLLSRYDNFHAMHETIYDNLGNTN